MLNERLLQPPKLLAFVIQSLGGWKGVHVTFSSKILDG